MCLYRRTATVLTLISLALPLIARAGGWSPAIGVHSQTAVDDGFPEITITMDGVAWVTWMGVDPIEGDEEAYFSRWNGAAWDPPGTINPPNQTDDRFPKFSCSPLGDLWALWKGTDTTTPGAYCGLASRWNGSGWTTPDTVWCGGGRLDFTEMASVSNSEAWFVRDGAASEGASDIFVYHVTGAIHDAPFQFVRPNEPEYEPSITVGLDGVPWAIWFHVPPLAPQLSTIQFSRYVSGAWSAPDSVASPTGIIRLRVTTDPLGQHWVLCSGLDPSTGPFSEAIWALKQQGASWGPPERISHPIAAPDSGLAQLSVGRTCGGNLIGVWLERDLDSNTRIDIISNEWDGSTWRGPTLVGQLSDSAFVSWPAITRGSGRRWVAYMKSVPPTYAVTNVYATSSDDATTSADEFDFSVALKGHVAQIQWNVHLSTRTRLIRLWRTSESPILGVPSAPQARQILESPEAMGHFDDPLTGTGGTQFYWLQALDAQGQSSWAGPHSVDLFPPNLKPSLRMAPNPSAADVEISCDGCSGSSGMLEVFDIHGRRVRGIAMVPTSTGSSGGESIRRVRWDGTDDVGNPLGAGIYFVRYVGGPRVSQPRIMKLLRLR